MPSLAEFIILSFAVYRVTRLVMVDDITLSARLWLFDHVPEDGFIDRLWACPYCLSVWVAGAVYASWELVPETGYVWAFLALAGASTSIGDKLDSNF